MDSDIINSLVEDNRRLTRVVQMLTTGWQWSMLPNGARGWHFTTYLRDSELKALCLAVNAVLPPQLDDPLIKADL